MPVVKVKNLKNEEVGDLELSDEVFGAPLNKSLIYEAVKSYLANQRAGTSATKTRGDTSGSGKKLWKQKGTGRARIASLRSPLWTCGSRATGHTAFRRRCGAARSARCCPSGCARAALSSWITSSFRRTRRKT